MGVRGGLPKSVRFVDKGKGEGFRIVYVHIFQDVFLPKLLHMIKLQIFVKNIGKNREQWTHKNWTYELGGSIKSVRHFWGVSQKCTFVDKGEAEGEVKNAQICVYVFYRCPLSTRVFICQICSRNIFQKSYFKVKICIHSISRCSFFTDIVMSLIQSYNSYFNIEKWTFKVMSEDYYRAKRDKKETTWLEMCPLYEIWEKSRL